MLLKVKKFMGKKRIKNCRRLATKQSPGRHANCVFE